MKKLFILIGAVAVVIATFFVLTPREGVVPLPLAVLATSTTTEPGISEQPVRSAPLPPAPAPANASITVGDTLYPIVVPPSETVLSAMRTLALTTDFTFSGRDYSSLGFFVESINGKKQAGGYVWIFYMNGEKSSLGISSATLDPGDVVEWKYEKSY